MRSFPAVLLSALLTGCSSGITPYYYWQTARGQMELWRSAQDVSAVIADPGTPEALRLRLAEAQRIRDWASQALSLPDNGSYRRYADIGRPFVVWNVFATQALSIRPEQSCFPIAGCVSYRGFFAEEDARAYADTLSRRGLDVHVSGIPAYSTLGWFDDPLLSTFIHYPDTELVRLIVHELAHQVVYVRDDTEFNESFASAVEEEGVRRWLALPDRQALAERFERAQEMRAGFAALVTRYREALDALYASEASEAEKLVDKKRLIDALGADYRAMRDHRWNGFRGYDRWFAQDINNATLASIGLYTGAKPAFARLIAECDGDMPRVWERMRALAALPRDERRAALGLPPHPENHTP
ncbi:aminopeptidase [Methyloversatilis thermotolerans]|uniref:aminopeptidase n=1 Tax=Methyloversatilis thermotolerans TaxID=1346290 RepID=UPI0003788CF3|nr:aminopeptidase [Methyloversatilis thermotolerans]